MNKPFDVASKDLVELRPEDWVRFLGFVGSNISVVNADLATVTTDADRVIRVKKPKPYLLHIEFQAGRDSSLVARTLRYNVLLRVKYKVGVESVVVLLRRQADAPDITGNLAFSPSGVENAGERDPSLTFRYGVLRVWEIPVEAILNGPVATLPLAPVAKVTRKRLPQVIRQMETRLQQEPRELANRVLAASYILSGLRYSEEFATLLFAGVKQMKESTTYQAILREGREEGREEGKEQGQRENAREVLLRLGTLACGAPTEAQRKQVNTASFEQLDNWTNRVLQAKSWDEILA
jgi:predicted transposase YdaD